MSVKDTEGKKAKIDQDWLMLKIADIGYGLRFVIENRRCRQVFLKCLLHWSKR